MTSRTRRHRRIATPAIALLGALAMGGASYAQSCVQFSSFCRMLKRDALCDIIESGTPVGLNGYFNFNDRLYVFFTAPYAGNITEIHVPLIAESHDGVQYVEQELALIENNGFPNPGGTYLQQAPFGAVALDGPALTEGAQNVFKFLDENQTIPMAVPVTAGQQFVVRLTWGHDHADDCAPVLGACTNPNAATVPVDLDGCTFGASSIGAPGIPGGTADSCAIGVQGDWAIRVVIESTSEQVPTGACELPGGSCEVMRESDCECQNGTYHGDGSTDCGGTPTTGACCFSNGSCLELTQAQCDSVGATFQGLGTDCSTGCAPPCPSDTNSDNTVNVTDLLNVLTAWGPCVDCPEDVANDDDVVDVQDLLQVLTDWGDC